MKINHKWYETQRHKCQQTLELQLTDSITEDDIRTWCDNELEDNTKKDIINKMISDAQDRIGIDYDDSYVSDYDEFVDSFEDEFSVDE